MAKTLFDHLNAIYGDQSLSYYDNLTEGDKKTYNVYMLNRLISMHTDYLPLVAEATLYELDARSHYLFFSQLVPKKRIYSKYIKKHDEVTYPTELIDLLATHFLVSRAHAIDYLHIYHQSDRGKEELACVVALYGKSLNDY